MKGSDNSVFQVVRQVFRRVQTPSRVFSGFDFLALNHLTDVFVEHRSQFRFDRILKPTNKKSSTLFLDGSKSVNRNQSMTLYSRISLGKRRAMTSWSVLDWKWSEFKSRYVRRLASFDRAHGLAYQRLSLPHCDKIRPRPRLRRSRALSTTAVWTVIFYRFTIFVRRLFFLLFASAINPFSYSLVSIGVDKS